VAEDGLYKFSAKEKEKGRGGGSRVIPQGKRGREGVAGKVHFLILRIYFGPGEPDGGRRRRGQLLSGRLVTSLLQGRIRVMSFF